VCKRFVVGDGFVGYGLFGCCWSRGRLPDCLG